MANDDENFDRLVHVPAIMKLVIDIAKLILSEYM